MLDKPQSFGWWTEYILRILYSYPQYTIKYIINELDMLDGWILYSFAMYNDPVHKFSGLEMKTSYTAQEADALLVELKDHVKHGRIKI